jgi:uncharacterized protein (DUF1778 family)
MRNSTKRGQDRLEVRLTPKEKSILKRAALVEHKTLSAFILDRGAYSGPCRATIPVDAGRGCDAG